MSLSTKQFQQAVADAIKGVLNIYREADALLRELRGALDTPLVPRLLPSARRDPNARYLRGYVATVFVRASDQASTDEDDEDEDEDEDDEDGGKAAKKQLLFAAGSELLVARVAIYGSSMGGDLPKLTIHRVTACNVEDPVDVGTELRVPRPRWFYRLLTALDSHPGVTRSLPTTVKVFAANRSKAGKLRVDVLVPAQTFPMFELTPQKLEAIANEVRTT